MTHPVILVTGFEPFGAHPVNPSEELAKAVDGRQVGACVVRGAVVPVHHAEAGRRAARLVHELDPVAVLHLGLAAGRARIALERVAVNVMDYEIPDASGFRAAGQPCAADGPAAYVSTLPLDAVLAALTVEGVPAYVSSTAGTYLCNQTMYSTLHLLAGRGRSIPAGFVHLPLTPAMVAAAGVDEPSMDASLMLRAVEVTLGVIARRLP
jgi:pyroglutamyl-peptidase